MGNVCCASEPLWLNRNHARLQRMAYRKLFSLIPAASPGARALDIGCGAGRWCRFLADHGYRVTRIDLQPELIWTNRLRYPAMEFQCIPIQECAPREPFDLVSSVTVIQHVPFDEQGVVVQKIRALLKKDGRAPILENISDQGPHVFSNTLREWRGKFERHGFCLVAVHRYDYSPLGRLYRLATRRLASMLRGSPLREDRLTPEMLVASSAQNASVKPLQHSLRVIDGVVRGLLASIDTLIELLLSLFSISFPSIHCGFLFRAI